MGHRLPLPSFRTGRCWFYQKRHHGLFEDVLGPSPRAINLDWPIIAFRMCSGTAGPSTGSFSGNRSHWAQTGHTTLSDIWLGSIPLSSSSIPGSYLLLHLGQVTTGIAGRLRSMNELLNSRDTNPVAARAADDHPAGGAPPAAGHNP